MELTVSTIGEVESMKVIRDVVSLVPQAVQAVKGWNFKAGTLDGKAVRSKAAVILVFNPAINNPPNLLLRPATLSPEEHSQDLGFSPPQVTKAIYPRYPINSIAEGTVVLQVTITSSGHVGMVQTLRDITSLTPEAVRAVKGWKFQPGTLDGMAVLSSATVAFLFRRPL